MGNEKPPLPRAFLRVVPLLAIEVFQHPISIVTLSIGQMFVKNYLVVDRGGVEPLSLEATKYLSGIAPNRESSRPVSTTEIS